MKADELKEIIDAGENSGVEFKQTKIDTEDLAKEVVALCNLQGGLILFGVSDDGEIAGIDDKKLGDWAVEVCRSGLVEPEVIPFFENVMIGSKIVCVLKIAQGVDKPYFVKKQHRKIPYIRVGTSVRETTREELRRLFQASSYLHYDKTPIHTATFEDLAIEKIEQHFENYRYTNIKEENEEQKTRILINAGILYKGEEGIVPTLAGMLIFGREPSGFLSQSGIQFAHFQGTDISDKMQDRKTFDKTLVENIEAVCQAITINEPAPAKIEGLRRTDEIHYPEKVIREALINACAHRDYTIHGARIIVFLFDDKLVIKSPGRPPNTVTVENMKIGFAVHRNPIIVKFLTDYYRSQGLMEGHGMGIPMIIREMKKVSGSEPEIKIIDEQTIITLYR
ncbi:MAG: RNA-binding domain-containing protein [bacterium]